MIGNGLRVKISDFAIFRPIYASHYFHLSSAVNPPVIPNNNTSAQVKVNLESFVKRIPQGKAVSRKFLFVPFAGYLTTLVLKGQSKSA